MPDSLLLQLPNTFRAFYGAFPSLRRAQKQAIAPILSGQDLVLQAATGSGKSEAVLAPCLERVISSGRKTAVLYIIPTRALAMDLKRRFESVITERLGLNFAIRTGDIKRTGGKRPDIMFTTPESLDVMLGSANADLKAFLFRVETIIIDEVHQLIHQYRGRHLVYLFTRLERRTGQPLHKIAMSATIAQMNSVINFFAFKDDAHCIITSVKRKIIARLLHIKQEESEFPALLNDLYDTWQYRKILIFANSRSACDRLFAIANRTGRFQGVSELHYSNLKPRERKMAEKRFRLGSCALCIATSTLELGIDVGDVDAVLLYEPPGSVSAFLQRIGRANRREKQINFWGICCGEGAGDQVVRFLALLELAGKGMMESYGARILPSVLSQQVISCLYEKKTISLPSLQSLFLNQQEILPCVFASLEKKHWLKRSKLQGLFGGGWQYRNHFLEYKIWGNFPEAEEEYILEVSEKAIADIPQSLVSQMDAGDRIFIAGRRLRILKIDTGEQKKVLARPSKGQNEKQLAWIGPGAHISYEVSQAMGDILKTGNIEDQTCLFNRTRKLFHRELKQGKNKVALENGIEIVSGRKAPFRYRTFLGAAGNLVLEWSIREEMVEEDLFISSDEIGLECSHCIRFEKLKLPVNQEEFQVWVKKHFKILGNLIPLNLFCKTLPKDLVIQEIMDFLFDHRITHAFAHYRNTSSKIISGDIANLTFGSPVQKVLEPLTLDIMPRDSLLEREKKKAKQHNSDERYNFLTRDQWRQPCLGPGNNLTLTATMVSDYFFYAQCQRQFCFKFLDFGSLAPSNKDQFKTISRGRGIIFEKQVLENLRQQDANIISMKTTGSEEKRYKAFLKTLNTFILTAKFPDIGDSIESLKPVFLSQCLLKMDVIGPDRSEQESFHMDGTGIPDLLALSLEEVKGEKRAILQVGDIKSSTSPRFHQKWQVAFYAWILEKIIKSQGIPARVSETGFLLFCSSKKSTEKHEFDLKSYIAAFPILINNLRTFLLHPVSAADHRLQSHCVSCDWFPFCYHNALENEEIQFLPGLTPGELLTLRQMGLTGIAQTYSALEKNSRDKDPENMEAGFTFENKTRLLGRCKAFLKNQVFLIKKNTRLFPNNISRAFLIHVKKDPLTGLPWALGWQIIDPRGEPVESHVRIMENQGDRKKAWQMFSTLISNSWEKSISAGNGPHIFHFGSQSRLDLLQWGEAQDGKKPKFLWQTRPSPWTDLARLFKTHFYMPAPGLVSLYSLGHVFGCNTQIDQNQTLFHHHGKTDLKTVEVKSSRPELSKTEQAGLESTVKSSLSLMADLYAKACLYLESQWTKEWNPGLEGGKEARLLPYLGFIKEEQRLKENDILALQELTLQERMMRFRAIGHLSFAHTRLDHEGRFLYIFKTAQETCVSKFRKGDFLKLAPHDIVDIQKGFPVIMAEYDIKAGEISLLSRSGKMHLSKNLLYSLEEDTSDWNLSKLTHVATTLFDGDQAHSLHQLLAGSAMEKQSLDSLSWLKKWLNHKDIGLNPSQKRALALPFQYRTSMIQGPPGTGKTHLLGWILIALIMEAHEAKRPIRIGVSALTHQAIDTVLEKVARFANQYFPGIFPGHCIKWGQTGQPETTNIEENIDEKNRRNIKVAFLNDADEVMDKPWLVLGATGYGFYTLFNSKNKGFPLALDWVIFDEASQVLIPQALLSLVYARGNFLFLGDVNQLPPIVLGDYGEFFKESSIPFLNRSILENFINIYPKEQQVTLDTTYRMNKEICEFPGKTWYQGFLHPAPANAFARLALNKPLHKINKNFKSIHKLDEILDPEKPVVLVLADHQGCFQRCLIEAELMAALAHRLIISNGVSPDQIALISPHRAQNNAIFKKLENMMPKNDRKLPVVDTIERIQGAERDIIIFGITSSDPDHLLSDFLNSPNRLNVAMTRAKTKLVIIGSRAFFSVIPDSEAMLEKNSCFKKLLSHCQKQKAVFHFP